MKRRPGDPIAVIEAGYQIGDSEVAWLAGVTDGVRPHFPDALGAIAFFFDREQPGEACIGASLGRNVDPAIAPGLGALYAGMPDALRREMLSGRPPIVSARQAFGAVFELPSVKAITPPGCEDSIGVSVCDVTGVGCVVAILSPCVAPIGASVARRWALLAAHLAAGLRLQRAADALAAEAVMDPSGAVREATGAATSKSARSALRDFVRRSERARGPLRRADGDEALSLWPALAAGRWSLIDRYEEGGRRFVLAVPNPPQVDDPRSLTPRERLVAAHLRFARPNKEIAYHLGIEEGTVAVLARRIGKKLGARSRAALVALLDDLQHPELAVTPTTLGGHDLIVGARPAPSGPATLRPAERAVALLAATGLTNAQIAAQLGRSPSTVANTMSRVLRRLGIGSRAEIARVMATSPAPEENPS